MLKDLLQLATQILKRRLDVPSLLRELERDGRTTVRRLRHSIRTLTPLRANRAARLRYHQLV